MKKYLLSASAGLMAFAAGQSQAVIDVTAATGGVLDAQVAILAVIGALMTMATVTFGITHVYRFLSKKSGV